MDWTSTRDGLVSRARAARDLWYGGMWRRERLDGSLLEVTGIVVLRSLYIVADAFRQDKIRLRAATLTFVTLLSLVPLLAVGFSLFTAFGGLEEVGERLRQLVVDALAVQQRDVVNEYLDKFIEGANAGGLGAVGSLFLFVTAVTTLSQIETAFNDIWGVTEARGWLRRFQVYLPLVTLGPVLFGLAFSTLLSFEASASVKAIVDAAPALKAVFRLGPVLVYTMLFFGLYMFLPNTRVRVGPGLIGALVGAGLYVVGQYVFTIYAGRAISYSAIYGSFGAVPLTILWINVSWTLVLLGATVSFAIQSARTYEPDRQVPQRECEQVAVRLVLSVGRAFAAGEGPISDQRLIDAALVPPRLGRRLLEDLVEGGLLLRVLLPDEEVGYAPARPLETVTLADVVDVVRGFPRSESLEDPVHRAGLELLDEADAEGQRQLAEQTIRDLLARAEPA